MRSAHKRCGFLLAGLADGRCGFWQCGGAGDLKCSVKNEIFLNRFF